MSQLYSFIRRKRRPLQASSMPAPADFLCPHCGRLAGATSVTLDPTLPAVPLVDVPPALPVAPVVEPVKVSKPKKSRGNAAKN